MLAGDVVAKFMGEHPESWLKGGGCVKAKFLISFWDLMVMEKAADPGFFVDAVKKYNIKTINDLLKRADERVVTMNAAPGESKALDALVAAAAFAMEDGSNFAFFMDVARGFQDSYDEGEEDEEEEEDEDGGEEEDGEDGEEAETKSKTEAETEAKTTAETTAETEGVVVAADMSMEASAEMAAKMPKLQALNGRLDEDWYGFKPDDFDAAVEQLLDTGKDAIMIEVTEETMSLE